MHGRSQALPTQNYYKLGLAETTSTGLRPGYPRTHRITPSLNIQAFSECQGEAGGSSLPLGYPWWRSGWNQTCIRTAGAGLGVTLQPSLDTCRPHSGTPTIAFNKLD